MLYYTTDEFVCVLPSAVTEGGIKFHQGILALVLAKVQVTVSTGKRGKYNSNEFLITIARVALQSHLPPIMVDSKRQFKSIDNKAIRHIYPHIHSIFEKIKY